jgi:phospholipid/cholesterol/gamma-HCH transport system substrate-binding protein
MHLTRRVMMQLLIFALVSTVSAGIMLFGYLKLPEMLFGVGRYTVAVDLPVSGGLYPRANVTYRGTEVGRVQSVDLTASGGVRATLSLRSDIKIPSNLDAEVHSQSAVGEQSIALVPRDANSAPLRSGDVIPASRSTVPPDINELLSAANRGLEAIPQQNLKTAVDESYAAMAGLGPDLARLVKGGSALAHDARKNLDSLTTLIDRSQPVLDSQIDTSRSIQAWAAHLAEITKSLQRHDESVNNVFHKAQPALDEINGLIERVKPTLPILLANLVTINRVAITYQPNLEQLLVLLPQGASIIQGVNVANRDTKQGYRGSFLSFNLNLNLPPPCVTGFMPSTQQRTASNIDYPERPAGNVYCRVPQDSPFNVRGARNLPCETVPGKRAPTVEMCESSENYTPLNDGYGWKGDPNATLSGQPVPQGAHPAVPAPPQGPAPPPAPPLAVTGYDPATGTYLGPDGEVHQQSDLAPANHGPTDWRSLLLPHSGP